MPLWRVWTMCSSRVLQIAGVRRRGGERKQVACGVCVGQAIDLFTDQIAARDAEDGFGGAIDEDVASISGVLDGNRNRHVLDDAIEEILGAAKLCGRGVEGFQLPKMNERNHQAGKRQCEKET